MDEAQFKPALGTMTPVETVLKKGEGRDKGKRWRGESN
jgi:hypothetical protein